MQKGVVVSVYATVGTIRFNACLNRSCETGTGETAGKQRHSMKIAVTSASFAFAFERGALTQLEWLDVCANELEVDGIVLDVADFPRTDDEYLAQIKKSATDLGLTVAAVSRAHDLPDEATFATALALGAPVAIGTAPLASDDPSAWNVFVDAAKTCARAAKKANVVVALASVPGTLCAEGAALRRIAYDVDGSWLRFAFDPLAFTDDDARGLLPESVIARAKLTGENAAAIVTKLARFRGFVVLESDSGEPRSAGYHAALARFCAERARFLEHEAANVVKT